VSFGCGQPSLKSYGSAGWRRGLKQKPTTVASRGFLSKFSFQQAPTASPITTTTRMTTCVTFFNIAKSSYKNEARRSSFFARTKQKLREAAVLIFNTFVFIWDS
jgi:hypothetical protein